MRNKQEMARNVAIQYFARFSGTVAFDEYSRYTPDEQRQVALYALQQRKRLGIGHFAPEEEFIQGFLRGYQQPGFSSDGLELFVRLH